MQPPLGAGLQPDLAVGSASTEVDAGRPTVFLPLPRRRQVRYWLNARAPQFHWLHRMDTEIYTHDNPYLQGESATHPIEPRYGTLAALLRLAGISPQRCHPCRARPSRSLSPFALSTGTQVPVEPQRSPLPSHRITAHSGASNCRF